MTARPVPTGGSERGGRSLRRDAVRNLVVADLVLFALLLLHDLDHVVRQHEPTSGPGGVPLYAWGVSLLGYVGLLAAAWLAGRGDRRAPVLTQAFGLGFAVAFILAHALPVGPGSYWAYKPGALSWALVIAPVLAGLAAVAVGRRAARAPE
jgi:hypothetical protein